MYEEAGGILFLFLEQPMHPGAGVSVGHVDLPIQREVHTGYPMVQSSGVKGSLREAVKNRGLLSDKLLSGKTKIDWIFGPENSAESRAAIVVTDARTLLFPVKSARGVFGWITSPHALARLAADIRAGSPDGGATAGTGSNGSGANHQSDGNTSQVETTSDDPRDPAETTSSQPPADNAAAGTVSSAFLAALENLSRESLAGTTSGTEQALWSEGSCLEIANRVILEDRVFERGGQENGIADAFSTVTTILSQQAIANQPYFSEQIREKTTIVPEDAFRDFVRFSTQIETHVKIGKNGTVEETGPWDEELIPAETLMYCLVGFQGTDQQPGKDALETFTRDVTNKLRHLQIGGDATLGRGITAMRFVPMADLLAATGAEAQAESNGGEA